MPQKHVKGRDQSRWSVTLTGGRACYKAKMRAHDEQSLAAIEPTTSRHVFTVPPGPDPDAGTGARLPSLPSLSSPSLKFPMRPPRVKARFGRNRIRTFRTRMRCPVASVELTLCVKEVGRSVGRVAPRDLSTVVAAILSLFRCHVARSTIREVPFGSTSGEVKTALRGPRRVYVVSSLSSNFSHGQMPAHVPNKSKSIGS